MDVTVFERHEGKCVDPIRSQEGLTIVNFRLTIEWISSEAKNMKPDELKKRTKQMSLDVLRIASAVPRSREGDVIAKQVIRSATSVAANYRAACNARSRADFINKLGIVEEEADETALWLEYILELSLADKQIVDRELKEVNELVAIFAASAITAKRNR